MTAEATDKPAQRTAGAVIFFNAGHSPTSAARPAPGSDGPSRLGIRGAAIGVFRLEWRDRQLLGLSVEDEFETTDVTAIHTSRFGQIAVVRDLGLAGGTLPEQARPQERVTRNRAEATCMPRRVGH